MSVELDRRIADAIRAIADEIPVDPPPVGHLRARPVQPARHHGRQPVRQSGRQPGWEPVRQSGRQPGRRWPGPVLAAAAVLAVLALVAVLPGSRAGRHLPPTGAPPTAPTLPSDFPLLSPLTAPVSASPPGPAIALYRQGAIGTRYLGTSQVVVVGADGRTCRRLDLAEQRGMNGGDGEWSAADAMLSPDGTAAAVADKFRSTEHIDVVDLRTGRAAAVRLDPPATVRLLDWSPDGRRLAVAMSDRPLDGASGAGELAIVDVSTGAVVRVAATPVNDWWTHASFSPDGTLLAVRGHAGPGQPPAILLVDAAGAVRRRLPVPDSQDVAGNAAWSPDGGLLVLSEPDRSRLVFLRATGAGGPVPDPIPHPRPFSEVLAWRSATSILVGANLADYELLDVPLDGSEPRVVSRIIQGAFRLGQVDVFQPADALVPRAEVRDVGLADRGPWPWWFRLLIAVVGLVVAWLAWRVRRRRRMFRPAPARPDDAAVPRAGPGGGG